MHISSTDIILSKELFQMPDYPIRIIYVDFISFFHSDMRYE